MPGVNGRDHEIEYVVIFDTDELDSLNKRIAVLEENFDEMLKALKSGDFKRIIAACAASGMVVTQVMLSMLREEQRETE